MKKCICLIISCLILSLGNTQENKGFYGQELPLLDMTLDLSQFCGSEYDSDGYQIRLCLPFSMVVPKGTRLISNETWDTRITLRENEEPISIEKTAGSPISLDDVLLIYEVLLSPNTFY